MVEPPQPGNRPGKCSRPPQQPAWFSKNSPSRFPGCGPCTRLSPRKLSHHSRRVLHDVPDLEGCFLWSGGIGLGKGLPCAVKPPASPAPHPCARLLSLQLRCLCVLPGAGAQINVSKQDLNQSHYWDQPGFWGHSDVSTSPKAVNTPLTPSPLWLSSRPFFAGPASYLMERWGQGSFASKDVAPSCLQAQKEHEAMGRQNPNAVEVPGMTALACFLSKISPCRCRSSARRIWSRRKGKGHRTATRNAQRPQHLLPPTRRALLIPWCSRTLSTPRPALMASTCQAPRTAASSVVELEERLLP